MIRHHSGAIEAQTACFVQDALGVPAFSTSQEAFAAEDLFGAYRTGYAAAVKALVAKPLFRTIDNQVCKPLVIVAQCASMAVMLCSA